MFLPTAMDTSAGHGEHSKRFTQELAKRHADCNLWACTVSSLKNSLRVSIELQWINAVILDNR